MTGSDHLVTLPVVLPMAVAGGMLLLDERHHGLKSALSFATVLATLGAALVLTGLAGGEGAARVYRLGDWPAPFGIVMVADALSTAMLVLTGVLGLAALTYSYARWSRAGPRFHALFLLLLAGVDGAFLTGDLFNLFVFFEVMLAASYGLVLHGSGESRVRAGLAYIAVNLVASLFFLVGAGLVYGTAGTLNMADLVRHAATLEAADRVPFEVGCVLLGLTFLIKASQWPLGFWLPSTYAAASPPAAAILAVLSKVGVYAVIRIGLLLSGADIAASGAADIILAAALATMAFGTVGILGARDLARAAAYAVMISSGTVLAVVATGNAAAAAGALYYLVGSTLAGACLFLLAGILQRGRDPAQSATEAVFDDEYEDPFADDATEGVGPAIPAAVAVLGTSYLLCALTLAGLPPLPGFVGKLAILAGLFAPGVPVAGTSWTIVAVLTLSGLGTLIPLLRFGVFNFWVPSEGPAPVMRAPEFAALAILAAALLGLTVWGGPALAQAQATMRWLGDPEAYAGAVLGEPAQGASPRGDSPRGDSPRGDLAP